MSTGPFQHLPPEVRARFRRSDRLRYRIAELARWTREPSERWVLPAHACGDRDRRPVAPRGWRALALAGPFASLGDAERAARRSFWTHAEPMHVFGLGRSSARTRRLPAFVVSGRPARRGDWRAQPMGERRSRAAVSLSSSASEWRELAFGLVPREQGDHELWIEGDGWIHRFVGVFGHPGWSARFEQHGARWNVAEVWVPGAGRAR